MNFLILKLNSQNTIVSFVFNLHTNYYNFKVMARIDDALASVENPDVLTKILLQTGAFHKKIAGFKPEIFRVSQGG